MALLAVEILSLVISMFNLDVFAFYFLVARSNHIFNVCFLLKLFFFVMFLFCRKTIRFACKCKHLQKIRKKNVNTQ